MRIAFTDTGRGAPLLFVHTGFSSFMWRDIVELLSDRYRCICVDAPGTGGSGDVAPDATTLESSARAVAAVIDTLDLSGVTLVMHDLGGIAALAAAARRPERIGALAAINTFAWRPDGSLRVMLGIVGSEPATWFDMRTQIVSRLTAGAFGTGRRADRGRRESVRHLLDANALRVFHAYMRDARSEGPIFDEIAAALRGPLRGLPLVTIFGEKNDPFGFQAKWKALFPGAWQVVVPGGNHFPMCDDPELVASTIDAFHRSMKEN